MSPLCARGMLGEGDVSQEHRTSPLRLTRTRLPKIQDNLKLAPPVMNLNRIFACRRPVEFISLLM